ncbi:hypothetical protein L914_14690 [Phytophthora nicotianae]|uniref:Mitochondrial cardiolipin hydrolase n=1 Tax=Phytophthora nicotianae TaxID=4792 RepID=W2MTZ6_PHYNI|nr:hypothetical protein L914_14690 [Phytophthora nicotianae]
MALLHRLEDNAVTGADLAFYALTDIAFCHALIWLHQLHKRVRVVIDRKWVRSCPSAIESVELLIAAGIDVRHRNPIIHYKLLILTYKVDIFVSSGSANLTTAAWNRSDELLVQTMGPPGQYVAQAMFKRLFKRSLKTGPVFNDLSPTEPIGFGSEHTGYSA